MKHAPVARIWLRIAIGMGLFAVAERIIQSNSGMARALSPVTIATAQAVEAILVWLGASAQRETTILTCPNGFGYQIDFACTGAIPAGGLLFAILVSDASVGAKFWGVTVGVPITLVLNLVRLVNLFYIGMQYPSFFLWAHSPVWECLMIAYLVVFFYLWKRRAQKASRESLTAETP